MQHRANINTTALPTRRHVAVGLASFGVALPCAGGNADAQAWNDIASRIGKLVGNAPVRQGRVTLELPELAENGNLVPLTLKVDSPMTAADHVVSVHIFCERNPLATLLTVYLGPDAGEANVQANLRLATSQRVTAIAHMSDDTFWSGTARVQVGVAACVDGG
jgi:sulfur-oxidizing protein SoxY